MKLRHKWIVSSSQTFFMALGIHLWLFSRPVVSSEAPFFQGKTITVLATTDPGGTGDLRVKALVPFLRKYIPGDPTLVIQYMGGGGGRQGTNHLYRNAKPDGLIIGALSGAVVGLEVLKESGVLYEVNRFLYLGSPESTNHYLIYTRRDLGLSNLEKLRAVEGLRIGAQSVGHVSYVAGRLFAYFLGLKEPKFITGYSGPEVDVALRNGELDGRANNVVSLLRRNTEWVEKGFLDFHTILEVPKGIKHPRFANLAEIENFARSEREVRLLTLWRVLRLAGSPYVLPPGTSKDRAEVLEEAMSKALKDPGFHREYKKLVGDDPEPLVAEELTKAIREMPREAEVIDLLRKISGSSPLPPR